MRFIFLAAVWIHLFYDQECCYDKHCRQVPCDQVQSNSTGWVWNGFEFKQKMLHISPDGNCHVCVIGGPVCIYLPERA